MSEATQALHRARNSNSTANFSAIFEGFQRKGIPTAQIEPRVNVLTYNAWLALGRQVRRKETSVRAGGACLFHISQTDPVQA